MLARSGRIDSLNQVANGLTMALDAHPTDLKRSGSLVRRPAHQQHQLPPPPQCQEPQQAQLQQQRHQPFQRSSAAPSPVAGSSGTSPASASTLSPWSNLTPSTSTHVSPTPSSHSSSTSVSSAGTAPRNSGFVVTSRARDYQPRPTSSSAPLEVADGHHDPIASTSASTSDSTYSITSTLTPPASTSRATRPTVTTYNSRQPHPSPIGRKPSDSSSRSGHGDGAPPNPNIVASPDSNAPKTTLHLSSSIDAHGRRMVNQYVRLKTIGQGSHGKVWLCAEPIVPEGDEDDESDDAKRDEDNALFDEDIVAAAARRMSKGKGPRADRWEHEIEAGNVRYCAIKSVAREGTGRGKSLRAAKGRKSSSQTSGGIGADDKVKREVAIMKQLDHPNIVRLKEVIDDAKSKKVFMVLEFMSGGQIAWQDDNKQPTMSVDEARRTFRDVVLGLEYLHYHGIIHRDIKPANLLWNDDHSVVKISDFGVSHVSEALRRASPDAQQDGSKEGTPKGDDDKALRKTAGSPAFFAPELCHPSDYTPTPTGSVYEASIGGGNYFPSGARDSPSLASNYGAASTPSGQVPVEVESTAPNGLPLSPHFISKPLLPPDPSRPRARAPIAQGIDVWALGVTLYCLLFGDTPFMARTEYELYNIIVKEPVQVPAVMGVERAWSGVGPAWASAADGVEGREAVDLLSRLLEKDPSRRITLPEVKKHPWVLRNLESSPDSWLYETDVGKSESVVVTEEDVQHATQERGASDTLPAIRNGPGIRRALNAALVRFPGFARMKRIERTPNAVPRSRSKSGSSNSQSITDAPTRTPSHSSRHSPDDNTTRKKTSLDFGMDLRRMLSREVSVSGSGRSASPATANGRGGWGNLGRPRQASGQSLEGTPTTPSSPLPVNQAFVDPELCRSSSTSSLRNGRGGFSFQRPSGLRKTSGDPVESAAPAAASHPPSDQESSGRRTLSRMLSKLGGGGNSNRRLSRQASTSDEEAAAHGVHAVILEGASAERFGNGGEKYDSFGRVVRSSTEDVTPSSSQNVASEAHRERDEDDVIDLTEFEYSESDDDDDVDDDDDDDDDFLASPLAQADSITGWSGDFAPFNVEWPGDNGTARMVHEVEASDHDDQYGMRRGKHNPASLKTIADSTPRGSMHHALSSRAVDNNSEPSPTPPSLIRQHSASPSRSLTKLSIGTMEQPSLLPEVAKEPSARGLSAGPVFSSRKWEAFADAEEEDDNEDEGILMAPRRRRAETISNTPPLA
ncbi:BQ5605_C001g00450 [Microbotryum silenes-dioicae]|uniref:BQ5605_C001g00450 protein n=1 Tax=Microbotryum silenes-dioicae TaxID=796604 RepID=A0A2X0M3E2_9BASI|nr:BQ5605_C001g00450 [Microbotryum silenes-dioicae]